MNRHDTVGIDLVAMSVNDCLCTGGEPLFFLDYLASGKLDAEVTEDVVTGLAEACKANGCALIGGETAQMPGFYSDGEYDLAGFIVGAVDRDKLLTGAGIKAGDVLIGASDGASAIAFMGSGSGPAMKTAMPLAPAISPKTTKADTRPILRNILGAEPI